MLFADKICLTVVFDHAQRIDQLIADANLNMHMRLVRAFAGDLPHRADRIAGADLILFFHGEVRVQTSVIDRKVSAIHLDNHAV